VEEEEEVEKLRHQSSSLLRFFLCGKFTQLFLPFTLPHESTRKLCVLAFVAANKKLALHQRSLNSFNYMENVNVCQQNNYELADASSNLFLTKKERRIPQQNSI